jgi:hypothetical protein
MSGQKNEPIGPIATCGQLDRFWGFTIVNLRTELG